MKLIKREITSFGERFTYAPDNDPRPEIQVPEVIKKVPDGTTKPRCPSCEEKKRLAKLRKKSQDQGGLQ